MLPEVVDLLPSSVMAPPETTGLGDAFSTAVGGPWMVTEATAAVLCWPRLSVTTRLKFTTPPVFGTVTATLDVGAVVVMVCPAVIGVAFAVAAG
jgi:hypothetical protein